MVVACVLAQGCAAGEDEGAGTRRDGAVDDLGVSDTNADVGDTSTPADGSTDTGAAPDTGITPDTGTGADTGASADTGIGTDTGIGIDTSTGPITGGPCSSGAAGATAFRIQWKDSGGTATVNYEVNGLPDKSGFKVAAYSTSFGYTPVYSDKFLAVGGLELGGTTFVDIDLSMSGLSSIKSATLSLYGRSFSTGSSGSFTWQTFDGSGASGSISNAAPYHWDSTLVTSGLTVGKVHKLRIKPGPPSGALVIHRIELCIQI